MSKPKKSIGEWLSGVLGSSHKAVSENLTAEQYKQLVADAEKYRASQSEGGESDEETDDDEEEQEEEESETPDPKNNTFEARLSLLENGLSTVKAALKSEVKAHKATTAKLTETEGKLKLAEEQKGKLRQAVNPLGDEDITNQESQNSGLTQVDIEARAAWKKNHPKA